ncbi:MAG TPA: ribonuclease Z [Nitrospiraceae bacterium]|nr:ribonuclease Z [Nitrospiraceae bacterium]
MGTKVETGLTVRLTILGSGTNVHPTRAAAGYLVQTDQTLLLDFGPRTLMNLVKTGTDRHQIRHILFSHFHADHFSDFITFFFDAVIHSRFVGKRPDLTLIGPRGTKRLFGSILKTFPVFNAAAFRVKIREIADRSFRLGETRVMPRTVTHSPRLHCVGYRIEHDGKALAYSGDAEYCESLVHLCRSVDVAVLDCSFPANKPGPAHMHAGDCGIVAREAGVKRLILSHFYPVAERYDVKKQAGQRFRGKIIMGRDLMKVTV